MWQGREALAVAEVEGVDFYLREKQLPWCWGAMLDRRFSHLVPTAVTLDTLVEVLVEGVLGPEVGILAGLASPKQPLLYKYSHRTFLKVINIADVL